MRLRALEALQGLAALFAASSSASPSADPRLIAGPFTFTTHTYQVAVDVPRGLYRCLYPEEYVGSDHGIPLYLARPAACDAGGPVARDDGLPRIWIDYEHNVAETARDRGGAREPRTDAEAAAQPCRRPGPMPFRLLGRPAFGCRHRARRVVETILAAAYRQGRRGAPDSLLRLTLVTSARRLRRDEAALRTVAARLHVCADPDRTVAPDLPARGPVCPGF